MEEIERDKKYEIDTFRLISLLADFQDKSTNFMILGIIGSIVLVIPLVLILMTFYAPLNSLSGISATFVFSYFGIAILYYVYLRKRRFKKSFDKYLEMISSESLLSSSDYQRLLSSIRNELVHSVEKTEERKRETYPSEEEITNRKKELASLDKDMKNLEKRKMELFQVIMTYNKDIADLEQKLESLRQKATREGIDKPTKDSRKGE